MNRKVRIQVTDTQVIHSGSKAHADSAGSENTGCGGQTFDPATPLENDPGPKERDTGYNTGRNT